jgi:hypothetical protein
VDSALTRARLSVKLKSLLQRKIQARFAVRERRPAVSQFLC